VVGLWKREVGEGAGGPVGCEYGYGELDGGAVGGVCEVRVIVGLGWGWVEIWRVYNDRSDWRLDV
jgi:hypothetical protein